MKRQLPGSCFISFAQLIHLVPTGVCALETEKEISILQPAFYLDSAIEISESELGSLLARNLISISRMV